MTVFLIAVSSVLLISFLCSLSEACLLSTTHSQIAIMLQNRLRVGRVWLKFKEKIEHPIAVILIINTIANTAGAVVAGSAFTKLWGQGYFFVFSIFFTAAVLFLSEILPKSLGVRYRNAIAPILAPPLNLLIGVLRPLTWLTSRFSRMFYGKDAESGEFRVAQEIQSLTALARISGTISPYEETLIKESFDLSEMTASEIMIPADDLAVLSTHMTVQEALSMAQLAGHSRYPLIDGEARNSVLGYVTFKELSITEQTNPNASMGSICRNILFAEPGMRASQLLKFFVDSHEHIAVVRSMEGTILGMVTFEDILEEIAGEVKDQYERLPRKAFAIDDRHWIVGGGMPMSEVRNEIGVTAAVIESTREQLAAWLLEQLGRTPRHNDRVALGGYEFQVKRMRRGKASEIKVTKI